MNNKIFFGMMLILAISLSGLNNAFSKIINPELQNTERLYGLYINGEKEEEVNGIAVDKNGNVVVIGTTNSTQQVVDGNAYQSQYGGGGTDAFVIKYSPGGNKLWSTYFGGNGTDKGLAIKITGDDKIIICGSTDSEGGISKTGFQNSKAGGIDGFIACFDKDGSLIWASYFGGANDDDAKDIAIDSKGNLIVTGTTNSPGLSTAGSYQGSINGVTDSYILKINSSFNKQWVTYFGGEEADTCNAVAIGANDNILIAGSTKSKTGISTAGSSQSSIGGMTDAFLTCLKADGSMIWSTYAGGTKNDYALDLACDLNYNIFMSGATISKENIATDSAYQTSLNIKSGGAMLLKYDTTGKKLYGTYFGRGNSSLPVLKDTSISTFGNAIICDNSNSYILVGTTHGKGLATKGVWQDTLVGGFDAFAIKFNEADKVIWSTYYGGTDNDYGNCVAYDMENNLYLGGKTYSIDYISNINTSTNLPDGFVSKITGYANLIINMNLIDSTFFPVTTTLMKSDGQGGYTEFYRQSFDSPGTIVTDIWNYQGPFKLSVIPEKSEFYRPYVYLFPDRMSILSIKEIKSMFVRTNYVQDSSRKGNISFYYANNGIYALNINSQLGSLYWPRGSDNEYIFGAGIWLGARKFINYDSIEWNYNTNQLDTIHYKTLHKFCMVTYNPNTGNSWMTPGRFDDKEAYSADYFYKYRALKSSDYNKSSGANEADPLSNNWPVWKDPSSYELKKFGAFVLDTGKRNRTDYPLGPLFISDEDVFSTYNDIEPGFYDGDKAQKIKYGYPLGLQFEQHIYSWDQSDMKDAMVVAYKIINVSKDTIYGCWLSPVIDFDLAVRNMTQSGASNDRSRYYNEDKSLELAVAWTNTDRGEAGKKFGYLGFSLIETPAVDEKGFLRHDKPFYSGNEQLGLVTYRNWAIQDDISDDASRYNFMSSAVQDGDFGPGDYRALLSTGPINLLPGDTTKVVLLINFALPAKGVDADGTTDDLIGLINGKKNANKYWNDYITFVEKARELSDNSMEVIPNPANESVMVYYNTTQSMVAGMPGNITFEMYNMLGEKISTPATYLHSEICTGIANFDLKELPAGIYIICLRNGEQTICKKIVKL